MSWLSAHLGGLPSQWADEDPMAIETVVRLLKQRQQNNEQ